MKNLKRISTVLAVILVAMSMVLFMIGCSCSDDNTDSSTPQSTPDSNVTSGSSPSGDNPDVPSENLVTVTVVDKDGNGIKNAAVQICQGEQCFNKPIVTGDNGTGSREYTLDGSTLKAKVLEIEGMDDYLAPAELGYVYFASGERELTITVQEVCVNVVDQSGAKIEGAVVQLTQGEYAFDDKIVTDANGKAVAYIALNGETITAVVTEVLSGAYDISSNPTSVVGYSATITVNKEINYTVTITDIKGNGVANASVKLYDCENGYLQKTVKTDKDGVAVFEGMDLADYYVTVEHESPAYVITTEATEGKYYFASGETALNLEAIELEELTYTVTLSNGMSGLKVEMLDENNETVTSAVTDENGVATFTLPNGTYVASLVTSDGMVANPVSFVKYGTTNGTITVSQGSNGTADNPVYIFSFGSVELKANVETYVAIPNAYRKVIALDYSSNLVLNTGDGTEELLATVGHSTVTGGEMAGDVFIFTLTSEEDTYVSVTVNAPGTYNNPINLNEETEDINGYEFTVDVGEYYTVYYTYTATSNGTLKITSENQYTSITIENVSTNMYPMAAGKTVVIAVTSLNEADYSSPNITADLAFSFGEESVSYKILVHVDGTLKSDLVVILYADNNGELTEVARGTTDANGAYVFENIPYASNYVAGVEIADNYEITNNSTAFGALSEVDLYVRHKNDGSYEHPYEFSVMGKEEADVQAGGSVWYTKFVNYGSSVTYILTSTSQNAVIKAYYYNETEPVATSSLVDGVVTLVFPENGNFYEIEVTTADGSAEKVAVEFSSKTLPEGSNADTAIQIEEAGTYSAQVKTELVYYVFTGMANKVTVTLNGDAKLYTVTNSMAGSSTQEAENNKIELTVNGNWLYFAISADAETECQYTITVE